MGIESNKLLNPDDPYLEASGKYVLFYYIRVQFFNYLNFINERRREKNQNKLTKYNTISCN